MTDKEKLIDFLWWKQKKLEEILGEGLCLMDKEIEKDIEGWDSEVCENTWKKIEFLAENTDELTDIEICPFCLKGVCNSCFFGKKKGMCNDDSSEYRKILNRGFSIDFNSIADILGLKNIRNKIKELRVK